MGVPIGDRLDALGVTADLDDTDLISSVVVVFTALLDGHERPPPVHRQQRRHRLHPTGRDAAPRRAGLLRTSRDGGRLMAYISLTIEYPDGTKVHARAQSDLADSDIATFKELTQQAVVGIRCTVSDLDDDGDDA